MKKVLLTLAIAAMASASAMAVELPLDQQLTLSKGDTYEFTPSADGILSIEFTGEYPDNGLVQSDLYNVNLNPTMEMMQLGTSNANPAMGQKSPALYEIKKYQPKESGSTDLVTYNIVGPDQKNITSITITCTFTPAGEGAVLEPSASPEPDTTLGIYDVGNLDIYFQPLTFGVTCGDINVELYKMDELVKTLPGSELELSWDFNPQEGKYMVNLQNLLLYHLVGSDYDKFTIILSDFNYELSGDIVNEEGNIEVTYFYDEWYGMITLESMSALPTITPNPANATLTLTYSAPLSDTGEVQLIGANLSDLNQEAMPNTNVYAPSYTISDNSIIIDFSEYTQTAPVNDDGSVILTDGIRTSGSVMTLIVRGFMGADGSLVQPVLDHLNYSTTQEPGGDEPDGPNDGVVEIQQDGTFSVTTLQGIRILTTENFDSVTNLPAGIYIVNGKKLWIK